MRCRISYTRRLDEITFKEIESCTPRVLLILQVISNLYPGLTKNMHEAGTSSLIFPRLAIGLSKNHFQEHFLVFRISKHTLTGCKSPIRKSGPTSISGSFG